MVSYVISREERKATKEKQDKERGHGAAFIWEFISLIFANLKVEIDLYIHVE